ncbi:MAG: dephospho-CoA kinase [Oscillospiraceae bacterium]
MVIGITGGTGSGKTSALQALEALGGTVLDCDAVYHQALREDETLRRRIRDAFGEVFRGTELDRQKLGSLVFSDPQALERLNGIIFDYLPTCCGGGWRKGAGGVGCHQPHRERPGGVVLPDGGGAGPRRAAGSADHAAGPYPGGVRTAAYSGPEAGQLLS